MELSLSCTKPSKCHVNIWQVSPQLQPRDHDEHGETAHSVADVKELTRAKSNPLSQIVQGLTYRDYRLADRPKQ